MAQGLAQKPVLAAILLCVVVQLCHGSGPAALLPGDAAPTSCFSLLDGDGFCTEAAGDAGTVDPVIVVAFDSADAFSNRLWAGDSIQVCGFPVLTKGERGGGSVQHSMQ